MTTMESAILRNLKKTYCRLQPSTISGIGVFAVRDIPASTDPFPVIRKEKWALISSSKLKGLDKQVLRMIEDFHVRENAGSIWISDAALNGVNISFFVNHSNRPNLRHTPSADFLTMRKIKKGEELTAAYETYDHKWGK